MPLIGMLDSPEVRRTAISLKLPWVPFKHRAAAMFSIFEQFHTINPAAKRSGEIAAGCPR